MPESGGGNSDGRRRFTPATLCLLLPVLAAGPVQAAQAVPVVYVAGLNSTYVGASCAPTDFGCTSAQPVGFAGRSAFLGELRKKGLQVVTKLPAHNGHFTVSSTLRNLEVAAKPDQDGHYSGTCEVTGLVQGGRIPPRLSELDLRHRFRLAPADFGPRHNLLPEGLEKAMVACLRRQAHWIAEIIRKYSRP